MSIIFHSLTHELPEDKLIEDFSCIEVSFVLDSSLKCDIFHRSITNLGPLMATNRKFMNLELFGEARFRRLFKEIRASKVVTVCTLQLRQEAPRMLAINDQGVEESRC